MFAKPRTFQSQELGGGQNNYFNNYPNNFNNIYDQIGPNPNFTRYPSGSVHSSNSNSMIHLVSSPEVNRSHYTQNYIRESSSQSGTQNSTFTTQSKNTYQSNHKKSHDNLKFNNFGMSELKKNLVLPPKKFSENSTLEPSKFNSKTMSILEKKNMDDTKNLVDFLNGLDEELIDYVRTQKGSR